MTSDILPRTYIDSLRDFRELTAQLNQAIALREQEKVVLICTNLQRALDEIKRQASIVRHEVRV